MTLKITTSDGPVVQVDDYYPFGLTMKNSTYERKKEMKWNLYNGKELQDDLDLGWYDYGARMYDAAIGRWHVVDRFSEEYYSISPYTYTTNNPISYVDVNGDTLWIQYVVYDDNNKASINKVYFNENILYDSDGNEIELSDELVGVYNAINQLSTQERGNELVSLFTGDSEHNLTIEINNRGITQSSSTENRVYFDPMDQTGGIDENGDIMRPSFVGLGHEIAHIEDDIKGGRESGTWYTVKTPNGDKDIPNTERYASHVENQVRSEHGLPLRTHYSYKMVNGTRVVDPRGSLLKRDNRSKFFLNPDGTPYQYQ